MEEKKITLEYRECEDVLLIDVEYCDIKFLNASGGMTSELTESRQLVLNIADAKARLLPLLLPPKD